MMVIITFYLSVTVNSLVDYKAKNINTTRRYTHCKVCDRIIFNCI